MVRIHEEEDFIGQLRYNIFKKFSSTEIVILEKMFKLVS
jgi:hypothetical protein